MWRTTSGLLSQAAKALRSKARNTPSPCIATAGSQDVPDRESGTGSGFPPTCAFSLVNPVKARTSLNRSTADIHDLHAAVKKALQLGTVGFDAVKHLVLCHVEKRPPKLDLDVYPYLPRAKVETTSAASYMALMSEGAA